MKWGGWDEYRLRDHSGPVGSGDGVSDHLFDVIIIMSLSRVMSYFFYIKGVLCSKSEVCVCVCVCVRVQS